MTTRARMICSQYFDDLEVGEAFETWGRTIGEFDIVSFGAITGDTNPQHVDRVFGERGPFGERVAHGALVLSFALGLVPIDPDRLVALRRLGNVTFKSPVQIGDTIHVQGRIASRSVVDEHTGLVVLATRIVNQHGKLAARMDIETVWRRDPARRDAPAASLAGVAT